MRNGILRHGGAAVLTSFAACIALCSPVLATPQTGAVGSTRQPPTSFVYAKSGSYATVPASSPIVTKAIPASDLAALAKMGDKVVTIKGTVFKVFVPSSKGLAMLDFAKKFSTTISVVVPADFGAKFPDLSAVMGKTILVTGKVSLFRNRPEIRLNAPSQIKIVK